MSVCRRALVILLSVLTALPALAQQSVVDRPALDRALAQRATQETADRDALAQFLRQPTVRELATRVGLDVATAEANIATLGGAELRELAEQARQANAITSGGASTITISVTTLIIVLLLVILILVAAD